MNKDYYWEYYQLERNHWWFKVRGQIISEHLKSYAFKKNIKILNVGIATGRTSELLQEIGFVTSLEYDKDCCEFVQEKVGIPVINGSVMHLPFEDRSFDLVCAFDVIEHVEDDLKAVIEMKRVCKKDGIICITVPAFMALWSQHDVVNQHYRRYNLNKVLNLFNTDNVGKLVYASYFNSILFFPILSFRLLSRLLPKSILRKGAGSDFTVLKKDSISNKILYNLFNIEKYMLRKFSFPFGVSIIVSWKK